MVVRVEYKALSDLGAALLSGSILASHPAAMGSILGISKNFSLDLAEIY